MSAIWNLHRIGSKTPFYEEPPLKTHYHPSPMRSLEPGMKQASAIRGTGDDVTALAADSDDNEQFLKGSNVYQRANVSAAWPLDSPSLDESWPQSEAPSSVENKKLSNWVDGSSEPAPGHCRAKERLASDTPSPPPLREKKKTRQQSESVLSKYIERFRHAAPACRDERRKQRMTADAGDFWWIEDGDHHHRSSTAMAMNKRSGVEPVNNGDQSKLSTADVSWLDEDTRLLQRKTDELLLANTASSEGSLQPAVSTIGVGSGDTSTAASIVSVEPYRPKFTLSNVGTDAPVPLKPDDDILEQWRRRRRLEQAREHIQHMQSTLSQTKLTVPSTHQIPGGSLWPSGSGVIGGNQLSSDSNFALDAFYRKLAQFATTGELPVSALDNAVICNADKVAPPVGTQQQQHSSTSRQKDAAIQVSESDDSMRLASQEMRHDQLQITATTTSASVGEPPASRLPPSQQQLDVLESSLVQSRMTRSNPQLIHGRLCDRAADENEMMVVKDETLICSGDSRYVDSDHRGYVTTKAQRISHGCHTSADDFSVGCIVDRSPLDDERATAVNIENSPPLAGYGDGGERSTIVPGRELPPPRVMEVNRVFYGNSPRRGISPRSGAVSPSCRQRRLRPNDRRHLEDPMESSNNETGNMDHSVSQVIKDRLFDVSDSFTMVSSIASSVHSEDTPIKDAVDEMAADADNEDLTTVLMSDGEEFADDPILKDLRQRRGSYLQLLLQLDNSIRSKKTVIVGGQ